ncbi:MAG TPA: alpha/beta hydrolase family protein [Frankiaceae bacterium]|jgi:S-formylglutathione hydrolase FrmB|nr:alpha/beta hydrolase family protein [Frankiaceae bacterium]
MRRTVAAVLAASVLAAGLAGASSAAPARPPLRCTGTGRVRSCTVFTTLKVRSNAVRVVLPASYRPGRRYPVVYVLHGVGDDETSWTDPKRGDLAALTATCEAIFVTPDGGSGRVAGWYSDWQDGSYDWERYHVEDLRLGVEATFGTTGRRAVAGLSMGGFGAMSYAARNPSLYRAAASYSGFLDTMFAAPATGAFYDASGQNDVYSTGAPSRGVWGDQQADAATWRAHNPWDLVPSLRHTALYVSGGTGVAAPSAPATAPMNAVEAYTRTLTDRFVARLDEAGIPYTDGRYDGGSHEWPYWRAAFTDSLRVLMPAVGARPC